MSTTNNLINPIEKIVPLHSIPNEKLIVPDRIWDALKTWKSNVQFWETESKYFHKLIRWNRTAFKSEKGKSICGQFNLITKNELSAIHAKLIYVEKEIIAILLNNTSESKKSIFKFQKLEKELSAFRKKYRNIKLNLLEEMANTTTVTFF